MNEAQQKNHDLVCMTAIRHYFAHLENETDKLNEDRDNNMSKIQSVEHYKYMAKGAFDYLAKKWNVKTPLPLEAHYKPKKA